MKVIIDPGHGGNDSGAVGPTGLKEKDVAWQISVITAGELARHGIVVMFTRAGDERVSLDKRVKIANDAKADYFVSIHANSASNPRATGTETYAYAPGVEGDRLAHSIQRSLVQAIGLADRGVKYDTLKVTRATNMPAALVEVAFMSNPDEEKLLKSDEFIRSVGVGIGKGILDYLGVDYVVETWQEKQGLEHLKNLTAKGIIDSPEYWKNKLLEPMPAWAIFALIDRGLEG